MPAFALYLLRLPPLKRPSALPRPGPMYSLAGLDLVALRAALRRLRGRLRGTADRRADLSLGGVFRFRLGRFGKRPYCRQSPLDYRLVNGFFHVQPSDNAFLSETCETSRYLCGSEPLFPSETAPPGFALKNSTSCSVYAGGFACFAFRQGVARNGALHLCQHVPLAIARAGFYLPVEDLEWPQHPGQSPGV